MIPAEVRLELDTADEPLEVMEESEEVGLGSEKISIIESMLASWCDKGGYRDSTVNMPMLSVKLGIPRNELSLYFENYLKSSFRIWLSDIRFKEAQRMLLEECRYSNDTISSECGFSSHAHLYKIFKAKTGFTPGQWRDSVRKTGSLMWMDYKTILRSMTTSIYVAGCLYVAVLFYFSDKRFVSTILFCNFAPQNI